MKIIFDGAFAGGVGGRHVADLAEDGSFGSPGAIVAAQAPENPTVRIRIAAVEAIDDKAVYAVTRPFIAAAQRLENYQRLTQFATVLQRASRAKL